MGAVRNGASGGNRTHIFRLEGEGNSQITTDANWCPGFASNENLLFFRQTCRPTTPPGHWERGDDLNVCPLGYEPSELPDCSTPHQTLVACPSVELGEPAYETSVFAGTQALYRPPRLWRPSSRRGLALSPRPKPVAKGSRDKRLPPHANPDPVDPPWSFPAAAVHCLSGSREPSAGLGACALLVAHGYAGPCYQATHLGSIGGPRWDRTTFRLL
jgi:hypothetical protein